MAANPELQRTCRQLRAGIAENDRRIAAHQAERQQRLDALAQLKDHDTDAPAEEPQPAAAKAPAKK